MDAKEKKMEEQTYVHKDHFNVNFKTGMNTATIYLWD